MVAFSSLPWTAHAQASTFGVYMTANSRKQCAQKLENFDKKKICLVAQPILKLEDISHITAMRLDLGNQPYFSLVVTEQGLTKLKGVAIAFPNQQVAVVVDNIVIGFLTDLDRLKSTSIKMTSNNASQVNLQMVHEKLKTVFPLRN